MIDDLTKDDFDKYVTPAKTRKQREFRTDRNNNPIAAAVTTGGRNQFTDALDQAEIPWEHGDPFPNNPKLSTIRIKGDPIEGARAILSNSNALKWYRGTTGKTILPKYGVRSSDDFAKLPIDHQNDIINGIYQSEGGSGKIKPTEDDFDKYVSASQATPDDDFDKYVTQEPQKSLDVAQAGVQGIPQPKEQVTSSVREADTKTELPVEQPLPAAKPIAFTQGNATPRKAGPTELMMQPFDEAPKGSAEEQLVEGRYKTPPSTELAQAVKIPFSPHLNPSEDDLVKGYLNALGPEYLKYGEKYKQETGRNILSLQAGDVDRDPDGSAYVKPTRAAVDVLNAYVKSGGDINAAKAEGARIAGERRGAVTTAQQQAAPDIAEVQAARTGLGTYSGATRAIESPVIRYGAGKIQQLGGLVSGFGIAPNSLSNYLNTRGKIMELGSSLPPLTPKGEQIQRSVPEKVGTALGDLGLGVFDIIAMKRATGLSTGQVMALEAALKNTDESLPKRGIDVAQAYAMGRILDGHLNRAMSSAIFAVPAGVRGTQAALNAPPEKQKEAMLDALLDAAVQGGLGAILGGGAKSEGLTELGARDATQTETQPNITAQPESAEPRSVPEATADVSRVQVGALQPEAQLGNVRADIPRHVDLQPRRQRGDGKGQFKSETRAQREERLAQVNPPVPAEQSTPAAPSEGGVPVPEGKQPVSRQEATDLGYTQRDPSDVRTFKAQSISDESLKSHLKKNGFKAGDTIVTPRGEAEIYQAASGLAYSWKPKTGRGRDGRIFIDDSEFTRHPTTWRDPQNPALTIQVSPQPETPKVEGGVSVGEGKPSQALAVQGKSIDLDRPIPTDALRAINRTFNQTVGPDIYGELPENPTGQDVVDLLADMGLSDQVISQSASKLKALGYGRIGDVEITDEGLRHFDPAIQRQVETEQADLTDQIRANIVRQSRSPQPETKASTTPIAEAAGVPSSPEPKGSSARPALVREPLTPIRTLSEGATSKAITERGTEVDTKLAIVDAKDLITSHDDLLNRNPVFPEELQPRDRSRQAGEVQIQKIEKNPRGELLSQSPKASDGAPIVGPDGIVESGNARTIGLRRAYAKDNADNYRQYLLDNAENFGIDPKSIEAAKEPVLVRLRTSDVNREQFAREANESSLAAMSAPEQAKSDARQLTSEHLAIFKPSESGEINTTANTPFVRAFMRDVVGPNDLGRYVSSDGEISQDGLTRIRNAIFARAYGDSPEGLRALEKIAESPDNNVRAISTALLQRAGQFASLKDGIEKGERYPVDITSDLTKSLAKMSSLREQGQAVADYLNQRGLFGDDLTPLQKQILKTFEGFKRSGRAISSVLDNYAKAVEAAGSPKQQAFFGRENPTKESFFDAALRETLDDAKKQPDLFSGEGVQSESGSRAENPPTTETAQAEPSVVRAARERAANRLAEKQQGIEYRHAGADPYEFIDSLIVRGWELYDQKIKPTFEEWSRKLREEFGPKADEHLGKVWAQISGGEQTAKRQTDIPGMEQSPAETTGIAHRVETAARGEEPSRGQAIGAQESVERGRQLLREGNLKDTIDAFDKSGAISADAMALVRARHEELAQAANRAFDVGRRKLDSPEFRAAEKVRQDFYDNAVKPMQTAWSNTGRAQQGETDIDTGTFYGMYRAFKDSKGREPSPREVVVMNRFADRNASVDSQVKNLSSQLAAELDRAAGIKDLPDEVQKSLSRFIDQARESRRAGRQQTRKSLDDEAVVIKQNLAAAFQKVRDRSGIQPSGLARIDPEGEITKQVIALAKNRAKAGITDAAQLIDDVHGAIKDFADVTKREVAEAILGQGAPKGQKVESEWAKTKKGVAATLKAVDAEAAQRELGKRLQRGPISSEDASAVWRYARENYVDKGNNNFAEIRAKVASDLGIAPDVVTRSLANTKAAKQLSNEIWAKMSDRRRLRSNAESWIKQADAPLAVKAFEDARRLWFIKATMGHGAVAPFTHAPANAFIPARWADFWRNFGRTYQFMVSKGGHERAMSDLETSSNYITAQRAGLANDPKRGYDEYQSPWMAKVLGKIGVSGNRAFDSLKTMRQDMFDSAWNKMTSDLKSPETARALAQEINASTGSSKALSGQDWPSRFVGKAMFAAPLEASRWDFLVRDNYRAIKAFSNWKNAKPEERYMAKRVASRNAQLVATYGALLAANQGLLTASGSDDKINVTDPTKSDFLAFKVAGHVISPAGGLLTAVRFVGNLVNIGLESKKPREKIGDAATTTFKYGRSKLSPLFGTGADIWLQSDYGGRPLPFSKEEGTIKSPRYTWPEYVWSTQTPIPLAEAARTYYAEREKGASNAGALAKSVPIGAVAATGIRVREDFPSGPASDIYGSDRPGSRKEIERLGMPLRGAQRHPDETRKEFAERQPLVNGYIRRALEKEVANPEYQKDSDENKIERLKQVKTAAEKEGQAAYDATPRPQKFKKQKQTFPVPSGASQSLLKPWLPPRNPFKAGSEAFRT